MVLTVPFKEHKQTKVQEMTPTKMPDEIWVFNQPKKSHRKTQLRYYQDPGGSSGEMTKYIRADLAGDSGQYSAQKPAELGNVLTNEDVRVASVHVKNALDYCNDGTVPIIRRDAETLIRAAQQVQELKETNEFLDRKLGEAYRELEAAQSAPKVVTVAELAENLTMACTESYQADVEYLAKKYPNGVKVIE